MKKRPRRANGVSCVLLVAVLLSVGALISCTGEDRTPSLAGTASPSPTPAIIDGEPCPPPPADLDLGPNVGCVSETAGTFELHEEGETFIVYALVDERRLPTEWHLRVTRRSREALDEKVAIGSDASYPLVLGAEDSDGRGLDEVFVKLLTHSYHSGKTHEVGIFGIRDGHFFQVEADGVPLLFQVGGVSVFGQGAECRDVDADGTPEFLLLHIDGVVGDVQKWTERTYRWRDRSLVLVEREEGRMAKTGYQDPLLWRYYSLRCLSFEPEYPYARPARR